jgi:hypothetical protein
VSCRGELPGAALGRTVYSRHSCMGDRPVAPTFFSNQAERSVRLLGLLLYLTDR